MSQTKLINTTNWEKINLYEEVTKLMYPDGFHKKAQHGLWKLKIKLNKEEWEEIKPLFNFYEKNEGEIVRNMKYYGWATINPVQVVKKLYSIRRD